MRNGKAVVLVVEDDAMIRIGAVDLVFSAGYEALEARADIDLVFTDAMADMLADKDPE